MWFLKSWVDERSVYSVNVTFSHMQWVDERSVYSVNVTLSHMQWVAGQKPAAQFRAHHESRLAFFHGPTFVVLHTFRVAARGPQRHSIAGQWPRRQFTWHHLADKENNYNERSNDVSI